MHGLDRFHGNGPYCKILTEKEPMRAQGLGLPYNNISYCKSIVFLCQRSIIKVFIMMGFLFTGRIATLKAFSGPSVDPTNSLQTIIFVLVLEMHASARPQPPWIGYGKFSGYHKLPITLTILLTLHDVMDFSLPIHRALWEAFLLLLLLFFVFVFVLFFVLFFISVEWSKVPQFR